MPTFKRGRGDGPAAPKLTRAAAAAAAEAAKNAPAHTPTAEALALQSVFTGPEEEDTPASSSDGGGSTTTDSAWGGFSSDEADEEEEEDEDGMQRRRRRRRKSRRGTHTHPATTTAAGVAARRLASTRRLHAALAAQHAVLSAALQAVHGGDPVAATAAAAAADKIGGRAARQPSPGPTRAGGETPCAAPPPAPAPAAPRLPPPSWPGRLAEAMPALARLEALAAAAAARELDACGALAALVGPAGHRALVRSPSVLIGRTTTTTGPTAAYPQPVDVDLGALVGPAAARKASRAQAWVDLVTPPRPAPPPEAEGGGAAAPAGGGGGPAPAKPPRPAHAVFVLTNVGRRVMMVDGALLPPGGTAPLRPWSLVEAGPGCRFTFIPNARAARRAVGWSKAVYGAYGGVQ